LIIYLDQLVLQQQENIDPLIGSIENLKKPRNKDTKLKSTEIPLIKSQNLIADDTSRPRKSKAIQTTELASKTSSNHKLIAGEVPSNWDFVTIDEAAKILKNNICYFNEERQFLYFSVLVCRNQILIIFKKL